MLEGTFGVELERYPLPARQKKVLADWDAYRNVLRSRGIELTIVSLMPHDILSIDDAVRKLTASKYNVETVRWRGLLVRPNGWKPPVEAPRSPRLQP